ncbi:MAG: BlaI/MecI/CopY family transcriptional regulator [Bacteroidaceae bacterium]|jgi:predicted transcriptional regulator|nr:BlaI/MecI/CopY family transcriptional regulator [Bacteroidaceae bacterium]
MRRKEDTLTKLEFEVMTILWDLDRPACAWDVLNLWSEPKLAYTTIATYLKVLYEKGYLDFSKNKGEGKTHMYVALVSRAEYTRRTMQDVKKNFFGGNLKSMFSYFVREENLSPEEIQELLSAISEE